MGMVLAAIKTEAVLLKIEARGSWRQFTRRIEKQTDRAYMWWMDDLDEMERLTVVAGVAMWSAGIASKVLVRRSNAAKK